MSKFGILLGAGIGYVLGTRDGRERYEQIRQQAQRVWKDPRVQQKKDQAADAAKQKGGELQDKASQKASEARSPRSSDSDGTSTSTPAAAPASTAGTTGTGTTGAGSGTPAGGTVPQTASEQTNG